MIIESYEINNSTIAIIPFGEKKSKIIEDENNYIINKYPTEIIDDSCKYFGSSYLGRFEGTKSLLGINYKSPIIIEETKEIIFFPTTSPRINSCFWICLKKIEKYLKNKHNTTLIFFKNGEKMELDVSYGSLENQILRATRLESVLRQRKTF